MSSNRGEKQGIFSLLPCGYTFVYLFLLTILYTQVRQIDVLAALGKHLNEHTEIKIIL